MLNEIKEGLNHFKEEVYPHDKDLYQDLSDHQTPHTLFVTCSDSRISIEKLLNTRAGEVFILRNVANLVPSAERASEDITSMASVEYAIKQLNVKEVIICGHSNCGGCASVMAGLENISTLPCTKRHLQGLEETKEDVLAKDYEDPSLAMEQANVIQQVENLKSHDFVQERLNDGSLEVIGMHYSIGDGEVLVYDEGTGAFQAF